MIPLTLQDIADVLGAELAGVADPSLRPSGVVRIDSRDIDPGDVFAAVVGGDLDGHDYVPQALERGAVLSLAARAVPGPHVVVDDVVQALATVARAAIDRRPGVAVVGITGSSGKTSTKDLLAQVLEDAGPTVSPPGSFNNEIGLPMTVLRTDDSTRFLVLEMGARGIGHIRDLCAVAPPAVGVVLNVGTAHVGEFGGVEATAQAKGELVESLASTGTAVLNADDPAVRAMAARTTASVLTFGLDPSADVRAVDVVLSKAGTASFTLTTATGSADVRLQVVGAHQVSNALAAAGAALALDVPLDAVAASLAAARPRSRWRMEVADSPAGVTVINDAYNANPESVRAALDALVTIGDGRRSWAVLGEMRELGDASQEAHREVGARVASREIGQLIVVGEAAAPILDGARAGGLAGDRAVLVADAEAAIALLHQAVLPGDVVLVKASRAVGLETVADALLAAGGSTHDTNESEEVR